jgi:hypothetical protein
LKCLSQTRRVSSHIYVHWIFKSFGWLGILCFSWYIKYILNCINMWHNSMQPLTLRVNFSISLILLGVFLYCNWTCLLSS